MTAAAVATTVAESPTTPAPAPVSLDGWLSLTDCSAVRALQRVLDEAGVDEPWLDICAKRFHAETEVQPKDASGHVWSRLYRFTIEGCPLGLLIAKKSTQTSSERHCAILVPASEECASRRDISDYLGRFAAEVQD